MRRYADDFEQWWQNYPSWRRKEKRSASEEWEKARKAGELPELEEAIRQVRRYAAEQLRIHPESMEELKRFTIYPARYIKRRRWEDELPPLPEERSSPSVSPETAAAKAALIEEIKREAREQAKRDREAARRWREQRGLPSHGGRT